MQLYYAPTSPYVRKVMVVAKELGIDGQIKTIPALVSDSGKAYFGSQTIVQYLDHVAGGNKVIAQTDFETRCDALTLEAIADGILDAAILIRYETVLRPEKYRWDEWIQGQTQKILLGLKALSDRLPRAKSDLRGAMLPDPVATGPLPLEGIAAACALWYLDLRFNDTIGWRGTKEGSPLKEWYEGIQKRASWKDETSS
ncbi:Glutathione S-transferase protein [Tulasnella sp. 330]|nr:Glutathione S-transferase protein [Tulasnella sp. 330]